MLSNNKGFSLIELMVVVAIIAILSTIAIPSYQNFQAKARQKEGFALLSAYYTAAQATRAEHGFFPGDFVATGFQPTGQLHYRLTGAAGNNPTLITRVNDNQFFGTYSTACTDTSMACGCMPNACVPVYTDTWREVTVGGFVAAAPVGCAAAAAMNDSFEAVASGIIKTGGDADTYAMNHRKVLRMCNDGIN